MAKKISSSDLFEQEDLFKGVRDSASKTLAVFNELQAELKATAQGLKTELAANTQASTAQLKQFSAASEQANKLMQQAVQIEKLKAQADQQKIKAEQEIVKLQKMQAQETARLAKEQEKAAKLASNEASAYSKLSAELNKARKAYKDLAVQNQENSTEGKELLDTVTRLDAQLKKVDATVGQHQRNVGNYGEATKSLKLQLRELTQALQNMDASDPRFQEMAQRAGELKDQISDTQAVVKATAGSAMENFAGATAKAGQIGVAAFQGVQSSMMLLGVENENILAGMARLQALAGLGDALKTLGGLGDALTEIRAGFVAAASKMGLFTAAKQVDTTATVAQTTATNAANTATKGLNASMLLNPYVLVAASIGAMVYALYQLSSANKDVKLTTELSNQASRDSISAISGELNAADKLSRQLKDETLTRGQKIQKVKEFQSAYPGLLQNMNLETMSIDQINNQLSKNIELLKLQAKAKAIQQIREEQYKTQLEAQTKSAEEHMSTFDKWAEGGLLGFFIETEYDEKSGIGADNRKKIIDDTNKRINALDDLDKALQKDIDNLQKQGAQNSGIITDYSKMATGVSNHTTAVKDNSAALERQRKELERLNNISKLRTESLDAIQAAESEYQDTLLSDQQREINAVRDKYFILIEDAKKYGQDTTILEEAQQTALTAIDQKYADKRIAIEKSRQENILNQEEEFMTQYEQAINSDKQNEINSVREKYFTLIEMAKQRGLDTKVLEEKLQKELKAIDDKYAKDAQKLEEEKWKTTQDFAQKATDFLKKQSDERIALIDKEISAAEKQADMYRTLAANGNINAKESLAEQERIIAEGNRRKEREQKRQQRMELANTIYQTYASHAAKDPKTALMNTIKDASLLQAFISSLPMFYDGTEDTGAGGGVDGKGGFHAVLHPHERVIPKSLNDQIGNLTNEQLTRLAMEYQNGRLVGQDVAHSSMDLAILVNEMKDLKEIIKHKPETNIQLGEITQSAMEIVQSTRKGNTTVYNRFKVRK
jgi:hypothetical protein